MAISNDIIYREIEEIRKENAELKQMMLTLLKAAPVHMEKTVSAKSPAEIALQMARAGDVEASKAYLRGLSRSNRRAA